MITSFTVLPSTSPYPSSTSIQRLLSQKTVTLLGSKTTHDDDNDDNDDSDGPASSFATSSYLATCIPGLAHILADELAEIHPDITDITQSGSAAVTFIATREASLYALCWLRTAHRLSELVVSSEKAEERYNKVLIYNRDDLQDFVYNSLDVKEILGDGAGGLLTLSVKTVLNNAKGLPKELCHSHYTSLSIKNAICDLVRDMRGDRPDVDIEDPDVPIVAVLLGNDSFDGEKGASVSLYRSLHPPGSLHKRGYRQGSAIHKAAMKESLAAGLLREAGWHIKLQELKNNENDAEKIRLVDPMAGGGSFLLEAAMMAADIAPGLMRMRCGVPNHSLPPVTRWRGDENDKQIWKTVLLDANNRAKEGLKNMSRIQLHGNDIHPGAVDIMKSSLQAAGLSRFITTTSMDCKNLQVGQHDGDNEDIPPQFVVVNPPWGVRLTEDITDSWDGLRHFLRDVCPPNTEAWILSGHKEVSASLKLKRDRMIPIKTGDQYLRWIKYTIGGKKQLARAAKIPQEQRRFRGGDGGQQIVDTESSLPPQQEERRYRGGGEESMSPKPERTNTSRRTNTASTRNTTRRQNGGGTFPKKKKKKKKTTKNNAVNEWLV